MMVEQLITYLQSIPPEGVLLFALGITFLENLFPPSPSDTLLIFCGTMIGLGVVDFFSLWIVSSIGSVAGFLTMYYAGRLFGQKLIATPVFRFIPVDALQQVEAWFQKYGYWLIVANRFLSGTRAVISFFAGISKLRVDLTIILSTISSLLWNAILLYAGMWFGSNWRTITMYLEIYGKTLTSIIVLIVLILVARWIYQRRGGQQVTEETVTESRRTLPDVEKENSDTGSSAE